MGSLSPSFPVKMCLNLTEHCHEHQADTHEEQQDEVSGEQLWREPFRATLSVLQVLLHTVHQTVGLGAVTQLSAGFVNLERVADSYAPHLHERRIHCISVTELLLLVSIWKTRCDTLIQPVTDGHRIFLLPRDKMSSCDAQAVHSSLKYWFSSLFRPICTVL